MSDELKKRLARNAEERRATIRRRLRIVASYLATMAAVIFISLVLLPWIRRPGAETQQAYATVVEVLRSGKPLEDAPEEARARFLEHGEWSDSDVERLARLDQLLREASRALPETGSRSFSESSVKTPEEREFWKWVLAHTQVFLLIEQWEGKEARDLLRETVPLEE